MKELEEKIRQEYKTIIHLKEKDIENL